MYLVIFWGIVIFFVTISSIPYNPFSVRYHTRIYKLIPEGFGFFTKNPREQSRFIYKLNQFGKYDLISCRGSELTNVFGLFRNGRKRNVEMASILAQIQDSAWISGNLQKFDIQCDGKLINICNPIIAPEFIGDFIIVMQDRTPWPWANNTQFVMPYKKIRCRIER